MRGVLGGDDLADALHDGAVGDSGVAVAARRAGGEARAEEEAARVDPLRGDDEFVGDGAADGALVDVHELSGALHGERVERLDAAVEEVLLGGDEDLAEFFQCALAAVERGEEFARPLDAFADVGFGLGGGLPTIKSNFSSLKSNSRKSSFIYLPLNHSGGFNFLSISIAVIFS